MATSRDDIDQQLRSTECHFNWCLEQVGDWIDEPTMYMERLIDRYNSAHSRSLNSKLSTSLHLFYMMYKTNVEGWELFLENAIRILNLVTDPHGPTEVKKLPSLSSDMYKYSVEEFFLACCTDSDEQLEDDEEDLDDDQDDSSENHLLLERLEAATHIVYALQAHIERDTGASIDEIGDILRKIVPADRMDVRQHGFLLTVHVNLWYRLDKNDANLSAVVERLRLAFEQDPDDWVLARVYTKYVGFKRRRDRPHETTLADVKEIAQIVERFRNAKIPENALIYFKYYELEILYEYLRQLKENGPPHLIDYRDSLCEELIDKVRSGKLANCALILSYNVKNLDRSCEIVEHALTQTASPYAYAKAANVFRKAKRLERALECATRASEEAIGSCWQVLDLKMALGHSFEPRQFFQDVIEKFPSKSQIIHMHAFVYYVLKTDSISTALVHYVKALRDCEADHLPRYLESFYCTYINRKINTAELAYRVASYFLAEIQERGRPVVGQQLSKEGLGSCSVIVAIIDSMPEVKSRFQPPRSVDVDGIIFQLTGYNRRPRAGHYQPQAAQPRARFAEKKYDCTITNWRKK